MSNASFFYTANLARDIKSLVDYDLKDYFDDSGLVSDLHPQNLITYVLHRSDPVPTIHDSKIHERRVKKLQELLKQGERSIAIAKQELISIHKDEVMKGLANREFHKKLMIKFAMDLYLDGYKNAEPALKLRCPSMFSRVISSAYGAGVLELHTAEWVREYVDGSPLWSSGPGEYVDRPSAVVDLLLQFE
ncbi:hypothetical protein [Escherichia coli]|uniref:hypothetical protein n=1 Tax=Escherichia coli TaxID=562 RepID=UPI000CFD8610|nr:hypothetical protein [Escherichia coli]